MSRILPHSQGIRVQVTEYLEEVRTLVEENSAALSKNGAFRAVYKVTLGGDCILAELSTNDSPGLAAARSLLQRVPVLVACGQLDAAEITLRKLIETAFLCVFFADHPIEW